MRVEPDDHTGAEAPGSTGALIGAGLRDCLNRQPLHLGARAVARDARGAGVDDVPNARNRERGLGNVGRQNHAPANPRGARAKDSVLLCRRQPAVERQHLGIFGERTRCDLALNQLLRISNFALPREKNQGVARLFALKLAQRLGDAVDVVIGGV